MINDIVLSKVLYTYMISIVLILVVGIIYIVSEVLMHNFDSYNITYICCFTDVLFVKHIVCLMHIQELIASSL